MTYLDDKDLNTQIAPEALSAMTRDDSSRLDNAEASAIAEAKGYLSAYDTDKLFNDKKNRPAKLVSVLVSITIYNLSASLPARASDEVRRERYKDAIVWLNSLQAGKITPEDMPRRDNSQDTMLLGGQTPLTWDW